MRDRLHLLTASEASALIRGRQISVVSLVDASLQRIDALEPGVNAWVTVDREGALETARRLATESEAGRFRGPLHGVPVGLKDLYDVAGMTTTAGAAPFAHERPTEDAESVARLRRAGAVIVGKTTTTPFAYRDPCETRNPWNLGHTPGGSSSGSAAAVAARMVPLALGSQTLGSTLRPAAYCGVVGLKPTYGRISLRGVVPLAWSLDHAGIFCRSVADMALALQVLAGHDPADPHSAREPVADYLEAVSRAERPPRFGLVRQFFLERAGPEVGAHVEAVAQRLARAGAGLEEVKLPPSFAGVHEAGMRVMQVEAAAFHAVRFAAHAVRYPPQIRGAIEDGLKVRGVDYVAAQRGRGQFRAETAPLLARFDALIMPVTETAAPRGFSSTGDPVFCAPWTFAGVPAISLPSGLTQDGLPLAVQLVSGIFDEARLLAAARWCEAVLGFSGMPSESLVTQGGGREGSR